MFTVKALNWFWRISETTKRPGDKHLRGVQIKPNVSFLTCGSSFSFCFRPALPCWFLSIFSPLAIALIWPVYPSGQDFANVCNGKVSFRFVRFRCGNLQPSRVVLSPVLLFASRYCLTSLSTLRPKQVTLVQMDFTSPLVTQGNWFLRKPKPSLHLNVIWCFFREFLEPFWRKF